MSLFDGKVAIVTGAASGIGREIALRFAARGGTPVIADLNLDAADATAREIKAKGSDAFVVGMNVADEAQVEKGVADTIAKYGRIDVLVSNAGIQIVKPVVDFPFADWKRLLAVHLDGAFLLRVFGRLPITDVTRYSEAGVRKASGEETAGEFAPTLVSIYGEFAAAA